VVLVDLDQSVIRVFSCLNQPPQLELVRAHRFGSTFSLPSHQRVSAHPTSGHFPRQFPIKKNGLAVVATRWADLELDL